VDKKQQQNCVQVSTMRLCAAEVTSRQKRAKTRFQCFPGVSLISLPKSRMGVAVRTPAQAGRKMRFSLILHLFSSYVARFSIGLDSIRRRLSCG
jgi:hypothetical protein